MTIVVALLFSAVLSLFSFSAVSQSILNASEGNYLTNKYISLGRAENNLAIKQKELFLGVASKDAKIIHQDCGIIFYRLQAQGACGKVKSVVISTVAKRGDVSHCHPKPIIGNGVKSYMIKM